MSDGRWRMADVNWADCVAHRKVARETLLCVWRDGAPLGNRSLGMVVFEPSLLNHPRMLATVFPCAEFDPVPEPGPIII
jgi:hypothetical protein